jgi:hypothetical protein
MSTDNTPHFSPSTSGWYFPLKHGSSMPLDCVPVPRAEYERLLSYGGPLEAGADGQPRELQMAITPAVFQQMVAAAVDDLLDTLAQSWRYRSYISARAYANDPNPRFAAEAAALIAHGSACWTVLDDLEAAVLAGTAQMPATVDEVLALLPAPPERPVVP